jgi:hypothetical protein
MELNHQIRLCKPFPFLFGFRAIFHTTSGDNNEKSFKKLVSSAIQLANLLSLSHFNKVPPLKDLMNCPLRIASHMETA